VGRDVKNFLSFALFLFGWLLLDEFFRLDLFFLNRLLLLDRLLFFNGLRYCFNNWLFLLFNNRFGLFRLFDLNNGLLFNLLLDLFNFFFDDLSRCLFHHWLSNRLVLFYFLLLNSLNNLSRHLRLSSFFLDRLF
jgi:hypothetical protein